MYRITKEFAFEAAHHLPQMPEDHKCRRPHGHSYRVVVELESDVLDSFGFVLDYGALDFIKKDIDEYFDHKDLAEVFGGGYHTTAERLAKAFFERWDHGGTRWLLKSVTVCETAKTSSCYFRSPEEERLLEVERGK